MPTKMDPSHAVRELVRCASQSPRSTFCQQCADTFARALSVTFGDGEFEETADAFGRLWTWVRDSKDEE